MKAFKDVTFDEPIRNDFSPINKYNVETSLSSPTDHGLRKNVAKLFNIDTFI